MSEPNREQLLALALGVLPELAGERRRAVGGRRRLSPSRSSHQEGDLLHGLRARRHASAPTCSCWPACSTRLAGRYEVEFEVVEPSSTPAAETLVHLAVTLVRHRKARRASPRVTVSVPLGGANAVLPGRSPGTQSSRCGWWTCRPPAWRSSPSGAVGAGDLVRLVFPLGGRRLEVEARVVRLDPAPYGRHRSGCEITEIGDLDRRTIAQLAARRRPAGSGAGAPAGDGRGLRRHGHRERRSIRAPGIRPAGLTNHAFG